MSQHSKKDSSSHGNSTTRQRKQDEGSGNNSSSGGGGTSNKNQKQKQTPNGSAKSGISNSNSSTSFTLSSSSNSNSSSSSNVSGSNKMQTVASIHTKSSNSHGKAQLSKKDKQQKDKERHERAQLVLWRHPVKTSKYCALELIELLRSWSSSLLQQRLLLAVLIVLSVFLSIIYNIDGPHQVAIELVRGNTWFFVYWIGLGVLSSVGLGTGLHTFLLYLGPHIASVTLAAYECNSLNFPRPPYPDDIICPEEPYVKRMPNIWSIMSKVRLEAFLWGAGTALGELPPYFMAKAARRSGYDPEDAEELAEFEALNAKRHQKNLSLIDKGKLFMERVVERIGFFGILACASIPNPLFDLAGITCGHFLVPFWTFFGATLIGKAIIKMHIQKVFVIIAFNETLIERAVDLLAKLPIFGRKLQQPFKAFLQNQKKRLHRQQRGRHDDAGAGDSGNLLSKIFETFVIAMVCYFVVSIINSLAQSYHKRLHKKTRLNIATSGGAATASPTGTLRKQTAKHRALRD